jgi:hypothetical protein
MEYNDEKAECQDYSTEYVAQMPPPQGVSRGTVLKDAFAHCMRKRGWKLTTAKPPTTQPPIDASRAAGAVNQAPPASEQPLKAPAQQSTTAPAPAPASASQPAPGASTYQPATPYNAAPAVQPGRNFGNPY